jgi:NAD-dependent deacetylase
VTPAPAAAAPVAAARRILAGAKRLVAFSGAGLSAESGIPTFRDAATGGFWLEYDPMRLASPQGFAQDPDLVVRWYAERRRGVARARPNAAHLALADHGLAARTGLVNVTQNVDDLLQRAGARDLIALHGTLALDRCHGDCGYRERVDLADPPGPRPCPRCGAPMRPAVVWFGECLPLEEWSMAERAAASCDVMLVVGTAAEVHPAAGLIAMAAGGGASIVVVNTQPSAASAVAAAEVIAPAGAVLPELLAP